MKSVLGIIHSSPTGSSNAHEALEMLMIYAAFGFEVTVLLSGAGVLQLQKEQHPEVLNIKNHSALFAALEIYEIKQLLVDQKAVHEYQIEADDNLHFDLIDQATIKDYIAAHNEVLNF